MTIASMLPAARRLSGAALALSLGLSACDSVLEVTDPDIIQTASSASGAIALHNGVILRLVQATTGSGDNPDGLFLFGGLMADEWQSGDTFEQRNTSDQRQVAVTNSFLSTLSLRINRVRTEGQAAITALRTYAPEPQSRVGLMFALVAFAENQMGETFCNGIPFSEVSEGTIVFGDPVPYDSAFGRAISHADSALANRAGADSARIINLASVIKGRALLNRNQPAAAAAAVAGVPDAFVYQTTHSVNSADNVIWLQNISLKRYVLGDNEGGNGLPFWTANDPRVPRGTKAGLAFDGVAPYVAQGIWKARTDPVAIASGIEARLIEAEAALRNDDFTGFINKLNQARATRTGLPNLSDPGTTAGRDSLLFRERAFWMFGTGHRLGDLRRMIRQYNLSAESVFPTGTWFKGGPYGGDVNFPIPFNETNNPSFTGCTDRNP